MRLWNALAYAVVVRWPWFCGCCGNWRLAMVRDDDYWCLRCRRHVLTPPGWT